MPEDLLKNPQNDSTSGGGDATSGSGDEALPVTTAAPIGNMTNGASSNGTQSSTNQNSEQGEGMNKSLPASETAVEKSSDKVVDVRAAAERVTMNLANALGLPKNIAQEAIFAAGNIAEAMGSIGVNVTKIATDSLIKTAGDLGNLPLQLAQRGQQQSTEIQVRTT